MQHKFPSGKTLFEQERRKELFRRFSSFFLGVLIVFLAVSLYASYFYYSECDDESCFLTHIKNCDRATYVKEGEFDLEYKIVGYGLSGCSVGVSLVSNESNLRDIYQNSSMKCVTKLGFLDYPESSLGKCHGLLKEGFQEVIIDRLKVEIVRNIGDINLDVLKTG